MITYMKQHPRRTGSRNLSCLIYRKIMYITKYAPIITRKNQVSLYGLRKEKKSHNRDDFKQLGLQTAKHIR